MLIIGDQPNRQNAQCGAAVGVLPDLGHRNERQLVVPMTLREFGARSTLFRASSIRRRNVPRLVSRGRTHEQHSGSEAADDAQTCCAKHFNSRFMSEDLTAPMVEIRNKVFDKSPCPA